MDDCLVQYQAVEWGQAIIFWIAYNKNEMVAKL